MEIKNYYGRRAEEYEQIYNRDDPVRQAELNGIKKEMTLIFAGRSVLEAACGTGYFTEVISRSAKVITAFDFSPEVIEVAKSKNLNAYFLIDDAYEMKNITGSFDAGCANFLFSHIPKDKIPNFLELFHSRLDPHSVVFFADNLFVEGVGGELISKQDEDNTYKKRTLSDGTAYEIIKNYYTEVELRQIFELYSKNIEINISKCYWWIKYYL